MRATGWKLDRVQAAKQVVQEAVEFYGDDLAFGNVAVELQMLLGQREFVQSQIKALETHISNLHQKLYPDDKLLSIPGIGKVAAGVVRGVVGNLEMFSSLAAFRAYTGLVPRESSSGESRRRGHMSKAGPAVLRWSLYLAADAARRADPGLADLYRRLMAERGRCHTQAVCAVASHLVGRIWAVARENRPYNWYDLDGNQITKEQARSAALSLRVDPAVRARIRAKKGEPRTPQSRQPQAPQDVTQLPDENLIEAALKVVQSV